MRSRRRDGDIGALAAAGLLLAACGGADSIAPVGRVEERAPQITQASRPVSHAPAAHVVSRGETLYSIAWRYAFDYRELARWNDIRAPYTIYPGQRIRLTPPPSSAGARAGSGASEQRRHPYGTSRRMPASREPASTAASSAPAQSASAAPATAPPKAPSSLKRRPKPAAKSPGGAVKRWYWPAEGKVIRTFSRSGGKGIDIAGRLGQPILAASDGQVVYSGSGLIGYGQLIIVKHNKRFLSAYAHNNKILVKEGDEVRGGQRIAEMGKSGARQVMLHFEIRRDGRPTDPLRYLPK